MAPICYCPGPSTTDYSPYFIFLFALLLFVATLLGQVSPTTYIDNHSDLSKTQQIHINTPTK